MHDLNELINIKQELPSKLALILLMVTESHPGLIRRHQFAIPFAIHLESYFET